MARLDDSNPLVSSDVLLTIDTLTSGGSPIYFTEFSGIKHKRTDASYTEGLSGQMRYTQGGIESYEDATLGKHYDPDKDEAIFDWYETYKSGTPISIRLRPIKRTSSGSNVVEYRGTKAWDLTVQLTGCDFAEGVNLAESKVVMVKLSFRVINVSRA